MGITQPRVECIFSNRSMEQLFYAEQDFQASNVCIVETPSKFPTNKPSSTSNFFTHITTSYHTPQTCLPPPTPQAYPKPDASTSPSIPSRTSPAPKSPPPRLRPFDLLKSTIPMTRISGPSPTCTKPYVPSSRTHQLFLFNKHTTGGPRNPRRKHPPCGVVPC